MARRNSTEDLSTLQMALVGYQIERQRIEARIAEIQDRLNGKAASSAASVRATSPKAPRVKRILSAAALKRISAAQKKRWAEHRKRVAQAAREA